ncbi:DUF883 domain-containing protein [Pseudoalteromonas sp. MMG010]|uniref:DUF883 domain-containing protein n=1 Tax=Pseudoalteromonas sp. MMG010 TaxID=2822685 RepID=UPI001B39F3EA|nr:DUF883 domain-containing protein [Pseudoalteromonas sp. MMG010]MBQ4833977.1 DUF883 domain-containing protein [Pseudoalteromonas sp. MMG010]
MSQQKSTVTEAQSTTKASSTTEHPMTDKVQETLHNSVDALAEKAAATETSLKQSAKDGSENLSLKQQELLSKWDKSSVKSYAVKNPVATAGLAFAAGMLVTALFNKK